MVSVIQEALLMTVEEVTRTAQITRITWIADRRDQRDCRGPAEVLVLSADFLENNHPRMKGRQLPVNYFVPAFIRGNGEHHQKEREREAPNT